MGGPDENSHSKRSGHGLHLLYLPSLTVLIPRRSTKNTPRVGIMGLPTRVAKTALTQKTINIAAGEIIHGRIAG